MFRVNFLFFLSASKKRTDSREGLWRGHTSISLQDCFAWRWDLERGAEEAANGGWRFEREVFLCMWGLSKDVPGQGWIFWSPRQPQTYSVKRTPSIWNILLRTRNERAGEWQGEGQMEGGIREACGVLAQVTLSKEEIPELSVEMCQVWSTWGHLKSNVFLLKPQYLRSRGLPGPWECLAGQGKHRDKWSSQDQP